MDLDRFEDSNPLSTDGLASGKIEESVDATEALKHLDDIWYRGATRRARWMDLIGDYAGEEHFVLEGDSLMSKVLDDPMLAIGRMKDPETDQPDISFQIVHGYYILERILNDLILRHAKFDIIFFESNKSISIKAGQRPFVAASRILARSKLFIHLQKLDLPVIVFDDPDDPCWIQYLELKKPLFIMTNDGGIALDDMDNTGILLQRYFVFRVANMGLAFALLNGAEFKDSKILTFVFEFRPQVLKPSPRVSVLVSKIQDDHLAQCARAPSLVSLIKELDPAPLSHSSLFALIKNVCPNPTTRHRSSIVFLFILHSLITEGLSVQQRALPLPVLHSGLLEELSRTVLPEIFFVLSGYPEVAVDGRVFAHLIHFALDERPSSINVLVDRAKYEDALEIMARESPFEFDLDSINNHFPLPKTITAHTLSLGKAVQPYNLLPFENTVFSEALASVHVPVDGSIKEPSINSVFGETLLVSDTKHWHNNRKSIIPTRVEGKGHQLDQRSRFKQLRSEQRFQARLQKQAASLTGAFGTQLRQVSITSASSVAQSAVNKRGHDGSRQQSKKQPKLSKKKQMRQTIIQDQAQKKLSESKKWWGEHITRLSNSDHSLQSSELESLKRNPRASEPWLLVEITLYQLNLEITKWIEDSRRIDCSVCDNYVVFILRLLRDISVLCQKGVLISPKVKSFLESVFASIGFEACSQSLVPNCDPKTESPRYKLKKLLSSEGRLRYEFMKVEDPTEWQLRCFGEYMDRSMDSKADPRVLFDPDKWQRDVLDAVDRDDSILATAPTSAGKTFISFYAMEQVLRKSDTDITVYVAPTKALVMQVAAEVYARFRKSYNDDSQSLISVMTRDYRMGNVFKSQILVTVPEMLAIFLLSPLLVQNWTSRIKRIILDEIHSIGQESGGAVWEQILLLSPCPIIGLSATIGSPESFKGWLESVQKAKGHRLSFISHPYRYSHLRKHFFILKDEYDPKTFSGFQKPKESGQMRFLHPIGLTSLHTHSMPSDLALEPRDTFSLFQVLESKLGSDHRVVKDLQPSNYFSHREALLDQMDIIRYEANLKTFLSTLSPSTETKSIVTELQDVELRGNSSLYNAIPPRQTFLKNLLSMLCDLQAQNNLPAILFNFDRTNCEIMAKTILRQLEEAEASWKVSSTSWKIKMKQYERWKSNEKNRVREAEQTKNRDADERVLGEMLTTWESSFNPDGPVAEFSFAGRSKSYTSQELEEKFNDLTQPWGGNAPAWIISALKRGIAVHHSGMNKQYRTLIEGLFRDGFVRVMISTGTLALGINAPARTSVFCGDSPFLTALMYRQCAGRAGRRGFDLLGNVVFYGLPFSRVERLVMSKLPALGGSFPLTSTLILRLFNLLEGSGYSETAIRSIESITNLPRITHGSEIGRDEVLHHIRFSIDYLRRTGLIDKEGKPVNLFAVASHLFYTEPSNFALVELMQSGVIHEICNQSNREAARRTFVTVMAHLFTRRYLPRTYADPEYLTKLTKRYPSQVVLPHLPERVIEILERHDEEVLRVFTGYAVAYTNAHLSSTPDDALPISGRMPSSRSGSDSDISSFERHLQSVSIKAAVRSYFVANSGLSDDFKSVKELVRTSRGGLHLNDHAIPSLSHIVSHGKPNAGGSAEHALNAFALDFYTHGQLDPLVIANGIRRGDIWYYLQDFTMTLKAIVSGLEDLLLQKSKARGDDSDGAFLGDIIGADPAELEEEDPSTNNISGEVKVDGADDNLASESGLDEEKECVKDVKPVGVSKADWSMLSVVKEVATEFEQKFIAIGA